MISTNEALKYFRKLENKDRYYCKKINRELFSKVAHIANSYKKRFGYIAAKNIHIKNRDKNDDWKYVSYLNEYGEEGRFSIFYYIVAVYPKYTLGSVMELLEYSKVIEERPLGLGSLAEELIKILLLNEYLSDDIKLWLKMQ